MEHLLKIWGDIGGISEALDLPYPTVASWKRRGIPPRRYPRIIERAHRQGVTLTFEMLHETSLDRSEKGAA